MSEPRVIGTNANTPSPPPGFSGAVTPIRLRGGDNSDREFRPAEDITAKETALVMVLLLKLTLSREVVPLNWPEYITANGLDRHFVGV